MFTTPTAASVPSSSLASVEAEVQVARTLADEISRRAPCCCSDDPSLRHLVALSLSLPQLRPRSGTYSVTVCLRRRLTSLYALAAASSTSPSSTTARASAAARANTNANTTGGIDANTNNNTTTTNNNSALPLASDVVLTCTVEVTFPSKYPQEGCRWRPAPDSAMRTSSIGVPPADLHALSHNALYAARTMSSSESVLGGGSRMQQQRSQPPVLGSVDAMNAITAATEHQRRGCVACRPVVSARLQPAVTEKMLTWLGRAPPPLDVDVVAGDVAAATIPPFLRDFVALVRVWEALEVDVSQLSLMTRDRAACLYARPRVLTLAGPPRGPPRPEDTPLGVSGSSTTNNNSSSNAYVNAESVKTLRSSASTVEVPARPPQSAAAARDRLLVVPSSTTTKTGVSSATVVTAIPTHKQVGRAPRRRGFTAMLLPQGGVVAWGFPTAPRASSSAAPADSCRRSLPHVEGYYTACKHASSFTFSESRASSNAAPQMQVAPSHQHRASYSTSSPPSSTLRGAAHNNQSTNNNNNHLLLFTTQFILGSTLPSLILPVNVLQCTRRRCRWSDIRLYCGDAHAALHANARLCKSLELHDVANLFAALYRLAKGINTSGGGVAYTTEVIGPVLCHTVATLRKRLQPFWAGVAVCCLVLPDILNDRPLPYSQAQCSALVDVVRHTEHVLYLAQAYGPMSEARLTSKSLERSLGFQPVARYYSHCAPAAVLHQPVTHCAVCGLLLQSRHGVGQILDDSMVTAQTTTGNSIYSLPPSPVLKTGSLSMPSISAPDGCLVVQCVRCGHGGHVEHIAGWWGDPSVRCCPKGCDCLCVY